MLCWETYNIAGTAKACFVVFCHQITKLKISSFCLHVILAVRSTAHPVLVTHNLHFWAVSMTCALEELMWTLKTTRIVRHECVSRVQPIGTMNLCNQLNKSPSSSCWDSSSWNKWLSEPRAHTAKSHPRQTKTTYRHTKADTTYIWNFLTELRQLLNVW